jgi:starch synthase
LLSKGSLEFLKQSPWQPDVIVAADWPTGLIPNYLHTDYKNDPVLSKIAVVFSIHNIIFQGMFDPHFVSDMDYDSGQEEIPSFNNPRLSKLNFMRRGIMYADVVNTVSPTYANEITTPEYGELLDELLRERRSRLFGILNGTDYSIYNPTTNSALVKNYNSRSLQKRRENKLALQKEFNLSIQPDTPLFSIVSRLTDQKGFGLLFETAEPLFRDFDMQLVIVGSGDAHFMSFFKALAEKYPLNVAGHFTFDEDLPHRIFSGADVVLIPSKFEPSGLTQMEAMRYGTVPLVRKTGGLADSVIDYDPKSQKGTGFVFETFDQYSFFGAVVRALETYRYPKVWQNIQRQGMRSDYSWSNSAKEYSYLFEKAIVFHAQPAAE